LSYIFTAVNLSSETTIPLNAKIDLKRSRRTLSITSPGAGTSAKEQIKELRGAIRQSTGPDTKNRLQEQLDYMRSVEMAVIVSEDGEEERKFASQKLNIKPHRERMNTVDEHGHDVEYTFKDPANPLQLVFLCAM
jgi:hypothetical protein